MKYFATADTHFGHVNIIKYCERPFSSVAEMNATLIERWNNRISSGDTVYFLGDFAMGPGVDENFILSTLSCLNGNKKFVLGNHDEPSQKYKFPGLKKIIETNRPQGCMIVDHIHSVKIDGKLFVMCHFPMETWHQSHRESIHLHGHIHGRNFYQNLRPRRFDVGVDMYGGPVQITGDCRFLNNPKQWRIN